MKPNFLYFSPLS